MMVPVGRLTVMKIVPRNQYMAAMTFVTLPGSRSAARPGAGRGAGGVRLPALDLPHQYPGGDRRRYRHPLSDAQLHHADPALRSLRLSAAGRWNGDPDPALDGQKGLGISLPAGGAGGRRPLRPAALPVARPRNARALFSLNLFRNRTFSLGLGGSFAGRIGSGMLPFMTPVFLQIGLGFSPFTPG